MGPTAKRRKLNASSTAPAEVVFDADSRADYLTGFHKRKVARAKDAQEIAKKREREERIKERAEMRKQRKQQLEEHVEAINAALRKSVGHYSDESEEAAEWEGFDNPPDVHYQNEYVDEDKYTSVTVETVGISREGFVSSGQDAGSDEEGNLAVKLKKTNEGEEPGPPKHAEHGRKVKERRPKKKKKFAYESKVDRKVTRMKERSKNQLQAQARRAKS